MADLLGMLRAKTKCTRHYLQDPQKGCQDCEVEMLYKRMEKAFLENQQVTRLVQKSGVGLVGQTGTEYVIHQLENGAKI